MIEIATYQNLMSRIYFHYQSDAQTFSFKNIDSKILKENIEQ